MPRRLSANRSRHPGNDPSSESSAGMGARNPIPALVRIRFLRPPIGSLPTVAFRTHPRRHDCDSIELRTAGDAAPRLTLMTLPETLASYRGALAKGLRSYPLN